MLVSKKISILIFIIVLPQFCFTQNPSKKTWGVSITPGFSKTRDVGIVTFDPNTFINLEIFEPWQFAPHAEGFLKKERGHYGIIKSVGFSGYKYYDRWEYDPATIVTNYVWGKRSFIFVYFAYRVNREFTLGKISVIPEAGLSVDYMIRAMYDSESKVGSIHQNLLSKLDRTNFGFSAALKTKIKINEKFNLQIGPYYKILIKEYPLPFDKRLYFLGLSMDFIRSKN